MTISAILVGLLIFTIIVVVHELGHYWAARRAGIHVEEFSVGMGPRILYITRKGTIWSLKLLPLGGSCRMKGDEDGTDAEPDSFTSAKVGWRIVVIAGGAIMNFLLAFVLATIISMFNALPNAIISNFAEISPIREAGAEIGDRIVRVNNRSINIFGDFSLEMLRSDGSPIDIVIERDGQRHNITVTPRYLADEGRFLVGFTPGETRGIFYSPAQTGPEAQPWIQQDNFFGSIARGFHNTSLQVRFTLFAVSTLFSHGLDGIMGPLGIVATVGGDVGESVAAGGGMAAVWLLMSYTLLLSVNLGIINLLPLPALDGGRLIFLFLEAIRRKPINPDKEGMVHFAGFVLLMALAAVVFFNDIVRMISG